MGLLLWHLLACGVVALLLPLGCFGISSSHSLSISYLLLSEPDQELPQFVAEAYVNDLVFARYDSDTRRALPEVSWMSKVEVDDPHFWDWITQRALASEWRFRKDLQALQKHYNQTRGVHTLQRWFDYELSENGHKRGYFQYAYDGKDFLSLDTETLTWTAADLKAQVIKRKWETDLAVNQERKHFVEEVCSEWLSKIVVYGKQALMRREPPTVQVTCKKRFGDLETLSCSIRGFCPKEIDAVWKKDGEIMEMETFRRDVAPYSDGTYHAWLSIDIESKDRDRYWCHVEHDSLAEPLDVAWEKPASPELFLWALFAVILLLGIGIFSYLKCCRGSARSYWGFSEHCTRTTHERTEAP